jgi:hypothetical protein
VLLEFSNAIVDPRRSSEKDRAYEEHNWDSGDDEGHDLENHCPLSIMPLNRADAYLILAVSSKTFAHREFFSVSPTASSSSSQWQTL